MLDRLHVSGPLSRSELAKRTGLNRSTIGHLIGELAGRGLVREEPAPTTMGPGRPSPVASAEPNGAVVLAVELTVDSLATATMGLGGHVFGQVRVPTRRSQRSPAETIAELAELTVPLLASLPRPHSLAGVGVAVAGVVRRTDGFVHVAPNLGWREVPLGKMIAEALGMVRVKLANEADLGALAEHRRGVGNGATHMIYVAGEVGIGVGVIQDGKPMLGKSGYAGEAGHAVINPGSGRSCRCGSVGCWETEAGEEALALAAGVPDLAGQDLLDHLERNALESDPRTLEALDRVGEWVGLGLGNLVNTLNPELIVIGGFYHALYPYLESSILQGVAKSALAAPHEIVTIRQGELGPDAGLIGAAELVFSDILANPAAFTGVEAATPRDLRASGA